MKCEKCGYASSSDFKFCKNCGAPAPETVLPDCPTPKILKCVKNNLFLVLCLLLSASAGITLINIFGLFTVSGIISIPKNIIILLFAISCWLIYFDGKKNKLSAEHFKFLSISVLLKYIWGFFGSVAIILIGCLICAFPLIAAFFQSIEYGAPFDLNELFENGGALPVIAFVIIGILIILLGIAAIIINIVGRRAIHRFIRSVFKSVQNEAEHFLSLKTVPFWLIAFAVISFLADLFVFLTSPTTLLVIPQKVLYYAALIVAAFLIQNHFKKENT